jgi:putative transposase
MANIVHPLLTLLASLTRQELARQIRYLRAENEIGRLDLPARSRRAIVKRTPWSDTAKI